MSDDDASSSSTVILTKILAFRDDIIKLRFAACGGIHAACSLSGHIDNLISITPSSNRTRSIKPMATSACAKKQSVYPDSAAAANTGYVLLESCTFRSFLDGV